MAGNEGDGAGTDRETRLHEAAQRHGVSPEAGRAMLRALEAGGGRMAQFDHPEFGGMGQWFAGGMVMVGTMNDHALKARVSALCADLAPLAASERSAAASHASPATRRDWWPEGLGRPSSVGAQNATRYAVFPESRRLAIETEGRVAVYDTGGHRLTGVSQQQGGTGRLAFSGPDGPVTLDAFRPVGTDASPREPAPGPSAPREAAPVSSALDAPTVEPAAGPSIGGRPPASDPLTVLERLAELHRKGVLTDAEFAAKKTELLARL